MAPTAADRAKIRLLRSYDPAAAGDPDELDVPDPYYGGERGFEHVLDLVEAACAGLLAEVEADAVDPSERVTLVCSGHAPSASATAERRGDHRGALAAAAGRRPGRVREDQDRRAGRVLRGRGGRAATGSARRPAGRRCRPRSPTTPTLLVLPWLVEERPAGGTVERLGRELAALHAAGSPVFGAAQDGWIGAAELENGPADRWPEFYAGRRVLPYVRLLRDGGQLTGDEAAVFERLAARLPELAGPAEPPARIHGDLWTGNVLWSGGRGWLVDPAAHGGHRETDLAMLTLFARELGARLLAAYEEVTPLADGWRERQRLHQLHPLLVHAVLFGGGYLSAALSAAGEYCSRSGAAALAGAGRRPCR